VNTNFLSNNLVRLDEKSNLILLTTRRMRQPL